MQHANQKLVLDERAMTKKLVEDRFIQPKTSSRSGFGGIPAAGQYKESIEVSQGGKSNVHTYDYQRLANGQYRVSQLGQYGVVTNVELVSGKEMWKRLIVTNSFHPATVEKSARNGKVPAQGEFTIESSNKDRVGGHDPVATVSRQDYRYRNIGKGSYLVTKLASYAGYPQMKIVSASQIPARAK